MADESDKKKIEKISQRSSKNYTRRDFLKTAGAAAAFGATSAFGASEFIKQIHRNNNFNRQQSSFQSSTPTGMATGEDYDIIEIDPGEHRVIRVDSGETFENKLIDMTADGASALVYAHGTNWTVRNIGFKGAISGDNRALTCSDQGGNTSTVENVYMGDGVVKSSVPSDQYAPALGIWVDPDHNGHLDFKNVYVEGALDNAFYCSAPGYNGKGGTIHIDRCYAKNNAISCYRLGSTGSKVTNSVAVGGPNTHRGVWAWDPGPVELENVHLAMNGDGQAIVAGANNNSTTVNGTNVQYDAKAGLNERYGSTINLDSQSGTNPEDFIPEGCPTSAEEAASGASGSGGTTPPSEGGSNNDSSDEPETPDNWDEDGKNHIEIELSGGSVDDPKEYRIEGKGNAEPGEYADTHKEDEIINQGEEFVIQGVLVGHIDDYYVEGEINNVDADPELDTKVNGEPTDLKDIGPENAGLDLPREKTIILQGGNQDNSANYLFEIDGEIESGDGKIFGNKAATGILEDETHEYKVNGKLTDFRAEEGITIEINSQEMNKEELIQMCEGR